MKGKNVWREAFFALVECDCEFTSHTWKSQHSINREEKSFPVDEEVIFDSSETFFIEAKNL